MSEVNKDFVGKSSDSNLGETVFLSNFASGGQLAPDEHEITQIKFEKFCKRLSWILFFLYFPVVVFCVSLIVAGVNFLNGAELAGMGLPRILEMFEVVILFGTAIVGLRSIRKIQRPFTKTMSVCILAIGIVVLFYSALMPTLFPQLRTGYDILSSGRFCLDGFGSTIGVLIVLFSRIYHYGVELQVSEDLTV